MAEQSSKETIRNTTLYTLIRHVGLTPQEVAQLRLADLHLAGKNPQIRFTPTGRDEPKTIDLDLEAHRALVGWLVARPDSVSDFLFPGSGAEAMAWQEIQQLVTKTETTPPAPPDEKPTQADGQPAAEGRKPPPVIPEAQPGQAKPRPPRSTPELGAPPPGMATASTFQPPPPTAPEEEPVSIPLPSSAPKPPPPSRPIPPPTSRPGQTPPVSRPGVPPPVVDSSAPKTEMAPKKKEASPSPSPKMGQLRAQEAVSRTSSKWSRWLVPTMVIILILLCVGCASGIWFVWQSDTSQQILARLGVVDASIGSFPNEQEIIASLTPALTPLPTPTLPPTSTPTSPPATNTPLPTDTPTSVPTDTPAPPTDTPIPTDTPVPTDAPAPTNTPAPAESPTPTDTPTPAMKYGAPVLLEPEDGALFNESNLIVLRWQSVGELASDEQYAVRLVYRYQNQTTYQGTNLRETEWTVPPSLYGQIDGPEYLYEWFVAVERLNDDGSGTAISPESSRRTFVWK